MGRSPRQTGAMHVVTTRRRVGEREYSTTLLRRSFREGGKVKKQTLANLSHLPPEAIEAVRATLRGEVLVGAGETFAIERSLPAGHVPAALVMARRLELARLLDRQPCRERDLCMAMIVERVIAPASKLQTVRALEQSTLASELGVDGVDEDDLYGAMDWLLERQARIEDRLARRHLADGELVLYDVSSSYFEGRSCPLAKLGYSRDGKRGTPQIIYGLLCDKPGRPIAVEVFSGELHDDKTLPSQVEKLKARFALKTVIVVSDRGMVTKANIELLRDTEGVGWITALKAPQIKRLVKDRALQLSLFDEHNLAEITAEDYPGERLVVCRNPLVAAERARKRDELLAATERGLAEITERVDARHAARRRRDRPRRRSRGQALPHEEALRARDHRHQLRLRPQDRPDRRRGRARRHLRAAHQRSRRTLATADVVRSYKRLEQVERAFGTLKGPELEIRPIHHRLAGTRPRPRLPLHARLLPHLAPAHGLGAAALQRREPADRRPIPSPRPTAPPPPSARPRPNAPPPASPATATAACSPSWRP